MDVATPQSEIYNKLLQIGWTLKKIDFKQGLYLAKAENSVTGQEIERAAKSPEMALAAVLRYAVAANDVRRFANKRLAAWDSNWSGNSTDIAQAYAQMPAFDQKAVPAWKALAAEAKVQADAIKKQITVEVVDDPDPYFSVKEMTKDIHQDRHVSVSRANSDHPIWTPEDVVNFRTVNDVIGHAQSGADFSYSGEVKAAETWMPLLSPLAREALFTEVIGRGAYDQKFRGNGPHKIGLLSQFLHPVQEEQGEHVWIPHGGLPDLQPQDPMETPFGPAVPEGYFSPAFERDPAVMEGYKPKKIGGIVGRDEEDGDRISQGARKEAPAERSSQAAQAQVVASPQQVGDFSFPDLSDALELAPHLVDNYQGVRDENAIGSGVGSAMNHHAYGGMSDPFLLAAQIIDGVQRNQGFVEGNKRTGTGLGLMFLAENGYPNAYMLADEPQAETMEELIVGMAEGRYTPEELAEYMRSQLAPKTASFGWHEASRDPDYLFVYYKSELRVKKWEHSLRQADMLEELLDEFDVDMGNSGLDIDPAEVAAGEIYAYPDGEYRVEHKQLSNPDVREYAEDLIQDWLWDWRSLDQARDPSSGQFV